MANLTQTATKVCCIIQDKDKSVNIDSLKNWLNENCKDWSYILHDKDINEDGTLKNRHFHFVFTLNKKKIRLSTTLNRICDCCGCNQFACSIDKVDNYGLYLQYLIHKNNPDKYQYPLSEVVSSLPFEEFSLVMTESLDIINFDILKTICSESMGSRLYIMERIGIGYYSKYRNVINDILAEIRQAETSFKNLK